MRIDPKVIEKARAMPDEPGCYLMRDRRGCIIYVGKAASLRKRVGSYFRQSSWRRADPKLRGLVRSVADIGFITARNEAEALLTEGRLIKEFKPRYNVSFRDDKRFPLIRVDTTRPYPRFELCRIRKSDGFEYFGPYVSGVGARAALDFIGKRFGIRKCRPDEPGPEDHKHCLDDIVRNCSAPCIGAVGRDEYAERVAGACAFLRGERPELLKEIRAEMEAASAALDFERAASLRDTYLELRELTSRRARVLGTPEIARETAMAGIRELASILGLGGVPRMIAAFDISNISGTFAVASMVCAADGLPRRNRYRRFRIRTVAAADDPAMMGEVVERAVASFAKSPGSMPDLLLVDGGAGQVRAAEAALEKIGAAVPVAGLAKKFEEIYRAGRRPVRLPAGSQALVVLQRLRDEAHRFALDYHRRLRNRAIGESVLDDIPGIGPRKKELLLRRFGSVRRLAAASKESIASVPGIGDSLAGLVLRETSGNRDAAGNRP